MNDQCRFEPEILRATSDSRWTDALRRHVADCETCAAAAAVTPFMADFASIEARQRPLPDPAVLWLKAQFMAGSAAVDRAVRPMHVYNFIAYFAVAAAWAAILTWNWSALQRWLLSITPASVLQTAASSGPSLSMTFVVTVLLLSTVTVVVAVHTILADE